MRRVNLAPNVAAATEGQLIIGGGTRKVRWFLLVIGQPLKQPANAAEAKQRGYVQLGQDLAEDLHRQPAGR